MIDAHHGWNRSYKPVFIGFIFSLILTLGAYRIVSVKHIEVYLIPYAIMALAVIQTLVLAFFYMHLGLESKPRWNMMMFVFMILITLIIVGGSIWIMKNINYNAMAY